MTHFTTTYAEFMSTFHDRITRYVAACPVAVSGEHGHDTTLKLAIALVHGFDLSPDMAWGSSKRGTRNACPLGLSET